MRVRVFATLRDLLGAKSVDLVLKQPMAVRQLLGMLVEEYPSLGPKIWDANGKLTGYITILVNGRSIEYLDGLDSIVHDADGISLFPPVGGG